MNSKTIQMLNRESNERRLMQVAVFYSSIVVLLLLLLQIEQGVSLPGKSFLGRGLILPQLPGHPVGNVVPFDDPRLVVKGRIDSPATNHGELPCTYMGRAAQRDVCLTMLKLAKGIHPTGIDDEVERNDTSSSCDACELETSHPDDWSVEAFGNLTADRVPLNDSEDDGEWEVRRSTLREALYWVGMSKRLRTNVTTLNELAMGGGWKPIALIRYKEGFRQCANFGVVFASASTEEPGKTDVLVAIRHKMVAWDEIINMDMDQDFFGYERIRLALHSGYSKAAKAVLEQVRSPLLALVKNDKLGTLTLGGFSMGGSIAAALGIHIVRSLDWTGLLPPWKPRLRVITFGSPAFGDSTAIDFLLTHSEVESIIAQYDFVPEIPCNSAPICFEKSYFAPHDPSSDESRVLRHPMKWVDYGKTPNRVMIDPTHLNYSSALLGYHAAAYGIQVKDKWNKPLRRLYSRFTYQPRPPSLREELYGNLPPTPPPEI